VPELKVTEQLEEALAPVKAFKRMSSNGSKPALEDAPLRTIDPTKRMLDERKDAEPCRGSQGLMLADVRDGKVKMDTFLSQLSDEDLICLSRGEGMCSPKVTAGIAGAFGGVTDSLKSFGIPVAGCSDGPSGIRMDSGAMAMSNPSGTLIACSFDTFAVAQLYEYQGKELRLNKIDMLLGPGMNIHRCPLNGRNFEYFSEDPYLTGTMASAELTAMHRSGVTGVIKHFACNNQEKGRNTANAVVSERALREIYLKGFEIAVKKGGAYAIMSTYGPVNGCWTAGNIDLCTVILRKQWHFSGIVMTDWSAMISDDQKEPDRKNVSAMIRAQNDIYMVNDDAASNSRGDDAEKALKSGKITRGDLLRNAKNILGVVMESPAMEFFTGVKDEIRQIDRPTIHGMNQIFQPDVSVGKEGAVDLDIEGFRTEAGSADIYAVHAGVPGDYTITMYVSSDLAENAQINMTLSSGGTVKGSFTLFGTGGKTVEKELPLDAYVTQDPFICFYFAQSGMKVDRITIEYAGERGFRPELERRKDKEK
jgi:beta-glucosidase